MRTKRQQRPQPKDLKTSRRLATTARAVGQGIGATLRGRHETQKGRRQLVSEAKLKTILKDWPAPQKNIADQMVAKYGLPNEATTTKLFWYNNAGGNGPNYRAISCCITGRRSTRIS